MTAVIQSLADAIAVRHGIAPRGDWHAEIGRALHDLSVAPPEPGRPDPALVEQVAGALTVSETFFMRHHSQFAAVTEHLVQRYGRVATPLAVLSAGCSSGEEPYSLVLCLMRALGQYPIERIDIQACDITPEVIASARSGVYRTWSFRDVPAWLLERHFRVTDDGRYRLGDEVRERVRFRRQSIAAKVAELADASLDVVLFRNVGIYLCDEHLARLYAQFRRVLKPDGLLVVSPSDPRPPLDLFARTEHESTGIYILRSALEPIPVPSCAPVDRCRRPPAASPGERPSRAATVPASASPPAIAPAPALIRGAADAGRVEDAIVLATARVQRRPADPEAYLLLGQMQLAGAREHDFRAAIDNMRRAVFLAPEHPLARFWYAHALLAAGKTKKALVQLDALGEVLDAIPGDRRFEDADVSVSELREARTFLLEGVR